MITRKDIPKFLQAGLKTNFFSGYKTVETFYPLFTTEIPSEGASEDYAWLGATPTLREWKDERMPQGLKEFGFTIINKDYEATLVVDRNAIKDDRYGQVSIRAKSMGVEARKGMDRIAAEVIESGISEICYDGQNFFDTDHEEGDSGAQINYTSSALALSADNAKFIISRMMQYKNDKGELAGINPTHIMVPTGLEWTAKEIFDPVIVGVTTDPSKYSLRGRLKVIVNPYLTNSATVANSPYYTMDLSGAVRPFIFQNREEMQFVSLDSPTDYNNFMSKTLYYGCEARFAFGFGDWRYCYRAKG